MTDQAEAQAALDTVRELVNKYPYHDFEAAVLAALENLDARLKALEGK